MPEQLVLTERDPGGSTGNGRQPPLTGEPASSRTPPNATHQSRPHRGSGHARVAIGVRGILDHVSEAVMILVSAGPDIGVPYKH